MNTELKNTLLSYINTILSLKAWKNTSEPILFEGKYKGASKELLYYFDNIDLYSISRKNRDYKLLLETIEEFENALDNDWFPYEIIGLTIPQAYLFLKEIKQMLESDIEDEKIENMLIEKYHEVKNSNQRGDKK